MTEEMYKNCGYRFKGNSCKECPLGCKGKVDELQRLKQENEELETAYNEISNNSEILHENNCLRIANQKLSEDLSQAETSMRAWRNESINYKQALEEIKDLVKAISYLGSHGERELKFKIKNILEDVIDEEIY